MYTAAILLLILSLLGMAGVVEFVRHQRRLRSIPIRIHVNGTRGKSSVTRLIGAGLRAGGIPTITKVTGTYPRLILEDGSDVAVYRRGSANIIEQLAIARLAAERKAQALVIECMALQPQYQRITERQMIHATVGVITNVRLDHIDIMGRTLPEVAGVLAETIPAHQQLFTAENRIPHILEPLSEKKRTTFHLSHEESISPEEMEGFSYIEHRENVALALDVCRYFGIDRHVALHGMYTATPDAGVLRRVVVDVGGKRMTFYNAFAANDPDSTFMIWKRLRGEVGFDGTRIVLLNTRQDRMDRARQLAELVGRKLNPEMEYLLLIGQCTEVVKEMCLANGVEASRVLSVGWTTPEVVFEKALAVTERASTIVAIGNMGGMGGGVAEYFEKRSRSPNDRVGNHVGVGTEPAVV